MLGDEHLAFSVFDFKSLFNFGEVVVLEPEILLREAELVNEV